MVWKGPVTCFIQQFHLICLFSSSIVTSLTVWISKWIRVRSIAAKVLLSLFLSCSFGLCRKCGVRAWLKWRSCVRDNYQLKAKALAMELHCSCDHAMLWRGTGLWCLVPRLFILTSYLLHEAFLQVLRLQFRDRQCRNAGARGNNLFRLKFHAILKHCIVVFCTSVMIRCFSSFYAFSFSKMCPTFWSFSQFLSDYSRHCILLPLVFRIFQFSRPTDQTAGLFSRKAVVLFVPIYLSWYSRVL